MMVYGVRGLKPRHARARSMARLLVAPLIFAFVLFAMVRTAYAEVNWEEKGSTTGDTMHAQVAPWDWPDGRMNAVAEFLGYDWDSLSDETQDKLLSYDQVTTIRDKTKNLTYEYFQFEDPNYIERVLNEMSKDVLLVWNTMFGSTKVWDIECSWEEYKRAQLIFQACVYANNGGSGESGGGGEHGGGYVFSPSSGAITSDVVVYYTGLGDKLNDLDELEVSATGTYLDTLNNFISSSDYSDGVWNLFRPTGGNCGLIMYPEDAYILLSDEDDLLYLVNPTDSEIRYGMRNMGSRWDSTAQKVVINTKGSISNRTLAANDRVALQWAYCSDEGGSGPDGGGGGDGGGGDYTPTPKPDPKRPDEPEIHLPDIDIDPTIYDFGDPSIHIDVQLPDVTVQPDFTVNDDDWDISVNVNLDPVISVSGGGTDVTSWLSKILEAINNLRQENRTDFNWLRELNSSNTNILRNGLDDFDTDVIQGMGLMYDYMAIMNSDIHDDLDAVNRQIQKEGMYIVGELREVLQGRFQWLAENINQTLYDFDDDMLKELHTQAKYIVDNLEFDADNSKLEEWLQKIYMKLRKNPTGIPDVTQDPDGWTDALEDLIRKLLEGLIGAANVAELSQMLNDLSNRFPISIPWDLLAIVTLFSGEPVTPQFDFPIYFGSQHITDISVDLSPYEDVASVSRKMSLLLFACMLLMETKTLLNATTTVTRKAG